MKSQSGCCLFVKKAKVHSTLKRLQSAIALESKKGTGKVFSAREDKRSWQNGVILLSVHEK
jgi:hypothetical protein